VAYRFGLVGSAAVPFAASLASLAPPWPKGIVLATGLVELVGLILVYQFLERSTRKQINRIIVLSTVLFFSLSAVYLTCVSRFVYEAGPKHVLTAKGYVCNPL
jgi:uncharacterized membrane protein